MNPVLHGLRAVLLGALLLGGTAPLTLAQTVLLPVDEADARPDFFTFRAQLLTAIGRRDVAAVLAAVHPEIKNSFGGDDGIESFKSAWSIDQPDSALWATLATVLALGGSFDGHDRFIAPYTFSRWPDGVDSFENVAVIGEHVRARARPDAEGEVLGVFSYAILAAATARDMPADFTAVRLAGGTTGYVARRFVRSPIDYRAIFQKIAGRWQLVTFVAGD